MMPRREEISLDRRTFIAGLGGAVAWPLVARAQQQTDKVWRVGYLSPASATNFSVPYFDAFRLKLNDLGYVEGRNLGLYIRRANEDFARLPGLASELVSLTPHVIVSVGTDATLALQRDVIDPDSDDFKYRSNRHRVDKVARKARRQHNGAVQSRSRLYC